MKAFPYEQRDKNVIYQAREIKTRIIELLPGGQMPTCEMSSHVIFYVLDGEGRVTVNLKTAELKEKQCFITGPTTPSMTTENGVRIIGIQIAKACLSNLSSAI